MATIGNSDEFVSGIVARMGSNAENLSPESFLVAAESAELELGWEYPISAPLKVLWFYNRGVRHATYILMIESAHKFRYNKIFLQNRFEHYSKLIEKMDKDFEAAKNENTDIFGPTSFSEEFILNGMTTYIPNVRDYDQYGRE